MAVRCPVVLAAVLASCAPKQPPSVSATALASPAAMLADSIGRSIIARAMNADAQLRDPDSLYIANAEIVANGRARADAPRFAGVDSGGTIQLGSSRIAVTGAFIWGSVQYLWLPRDSAHKPAEGWATFIIGQTVSGAWRIYHVHSSVAGER